MTWLTADMRFMGIAVAFAVLLLPTILNPDATVPRKSSIPTASLLVALAVNFYLDGYMLAFAGNMTTAAAWTAIALFRAPSDQEEP